MNDKLSTLPPYPKGPEPELPPSRMEWGTALWVAFVVLLIGGFAAIFHWLILPGVGVFAFAPESLTVIIVGLALGGFAIFVVLLFVWQRRGGTRGTCGTRGTQPRG